MAHNRCTYVEAPGARTYTERMGADEYVEQTGPRTYVQRGGCRPASDAPSGFALIVVGGVRAQVGGSNLIAPEP